MRIELIGNLSTDASQKGDQFEARVIEPKEYEGATIQGRVVSVKRAGRARSTAQLQLAFEEIRFTDGRTSKMSAQVIEVIPGGGSQGAGKVDSEGGVQGTNSTKRDVEKVGGAAGIGAVIGAIASLWVMGHATLLLIGSPPRRRGGGVCATLDTTVAPGRVRCGRRQCRRRRR